MGGTPDSDHITPIHSVDLEVNPQTLDLGLSALTLKQEATRGGLDTEDWALGLWRHILVLGDFYFLFLNVS